MPNIYRHPRVVFPDMAESQLYDKFQPRDRDYILPDGETFFIPFDRSFLSAEDQIITVPIATIARYRVPRIHLWLEPCDVYPRGTRVQFRVFINENPYQCNVYVGRYYIIPVSSYAILDVDDVDQAYSDDMYVLSHGLVRMRFYTKGGTLLPELDEGDILQDIPMFNGLAEVTRC